MDRPPVNAHKRVSKRSSNACTRCRQQKIRCSGLQPCDGCTKRKLRCIFDDRDNKVLVTQGHLSALHDKIAQLERAAGGGVGSDSPELANYQVDNSADNPISQQQQQQQSSPISDQYRQYERGSPQGQRRALPQEPRPLRNLRPRHSQNTSVMQRQVLARDDHQEARPSADSIPAPPFEHGNSSAAQSEPEAAELTNPLATSPSTFVAAANGRAFYLGTSSAWSFSGKVLQMTHLHLYNTQLPSSAILFDECAYSLGWDGSRTKTTADDSLVIPSHDYAVYLINAVKFHGGQLFHLFDEHNFQSQLHQFYSNPAATRVGSAGLWYIHFLLILALGKAFVRSRVVNDRAPGAEYFTSALSGLPDTTYLCRDPVSSVEILCCVALYLQSVDHRNSAHVYIGQAMRVALGYGMHTAMPVHELGEPHVQRCRKAWWTVYVLDRQMTSLMGLPQSIRDTDIDCKMPDSSASAQPSTALGMQIRLSCIIAEINNTVYGANGRLNKKFLISTRNALESAAGLADELRQVMPLKLDEPGAGVPRLSASLHLLYHQCIVLATRPLVFCCLRMKYEGNPSLKTLISSRKIRTLLSVCTESCIQILTILENLQVQGILETFMTFDLDSLYVATIVLLLEPAIDLALFESQSGWTRRAFALLDEMVAGGNRIASFRKSEAERLSKMLLEISSADLQQMTKNSAGGAADEVADSGESSNNAAVGAMLSAAPGQGATLGIELAEPAAADFPAASQPSATGGFTHLLSPTDQQLYGFVDEWTAEQIIAVANSIESEDAEWMAQTMGQNSIW